MHYVSSVLITMKHFIAIFTTLFLLSNSSLQAVELKLASVFSDHMVLQREKPIKIWGQADAGTQVSVAFAGQTKTAAAETNGSWLVTLDPLPASAEPRELTVSSATTTVKISNILIGEVWLLGGQSNMEMPLWWRGESDGMQNAPNTRLALGTNHPCKHRPKSAARGG
jgi:sialate O-acetylesterase